MIRATDDNLLRPSFGLVKLSVNAILHQRPRFIHGASPLAIPK